MYRTIYIFIFSLFYLSFSFAQDTVSGTVTDGSQPLSGANVMVKDSNEGTITDENGQFTIEVQSFPAKLIISYVGYETIEEKITGPSNKKTRSYVLLSNYQNLDPVVVGASRFRERILNAPVTIYKLDAGQLKYKGAADYYRALDNVKGIQSQSSSLSLPSYNMRGFSDPANFRFKQQIDGIDMTNPIGLAIANTVGASDLDIRSMEIIPGASSALYGSDAFNGILQIYTKNPFEYPGLSFETKTGLTSQSVAGENFFGEFNLRLAHLLSDKVAVKVDLHHRRAYDWIGANRDHRIPTGQWENRDQYESLDLDDPDGYLAFDAVHRVGDEFGNGIGVIPFAVDLVDPSGDTMALAPRQLARTGIWEEDLVDNELKNFLGNFSIHYRPNEDWELSYMYKHSFGDWLIRSSVTFPQYDYLQRIHFFNASSDLINFRAYHHKLDNFRGSWSAPNAADAIQQALRSDEEWVADFTENYAQTGSLVEAREFADRFMPGGAQFNIEDFEAALAATSNNTDFAGTNSNVVKGSQAVDFSSYFNSDLDFDFTDKIPGIQLRAGLTYRRYHIESDGGFYNDGELGFGEPIIVNQYGAYAQASDRYLDDRLKVTAAFRFDNNEDYKENFSPRIAAVYSAGKDRNHNFRGSFQTGFRNPSIQEGFFRLQLTSAFTVIGAAERSLENFIYEGRTGNRFTMQEIIEEDGRGFEPVQPERNTIVEFGYKTLLDKKLLIDVNAYHTWYENFINRPTIFFRPGTPDFQIFAIRQNREETVISQGAGLALDYLWSNGLRTGLSYDWNDFDVVDYERDNKDAFLRSLQFNTPEHRLILSLGGSNLGPNERLGFNISFKYTSEFHFLSNFGEADIPAINYTDASVSYRMPVLKTTFKIGASNLFNQEYTYIAGGPPVGSVYFFSIRYEEL